MDEKVSLRRIALALKRLPMGVWSDPDHGASWSTTDHLLASLIDAVRENTWAIIQVNTTKGRHVERPKPTYRPGARKPTPTTPKKPQTWGDFARMLMAMEQQQTPVEPGP